MPFVWLGVGILIGVVLGAMVGWLVAAKKIRLVEGDLERTRSAAATAVARLEERETTSEERQAERNAREIELQTLRESIGRLEKENSRLQAELKSEKESAQEKIKLFEQAELRLRETFQALSSEALRKNNQSFLELAKEKLAETQKAAAVDLDSRKKSISEMVKPIQESLKSVDSKLQAVEKARAEAYGKINEQITSMVSGQEKLRGETANLVQALKQPSVRGRWGELQLRRVVELAGMTKHCDFIEQESRDSEDGRLRPDMVIRLPGNKHVIIDAKAPLAAYLQALEATDDATRKRLLADHAKQVRSRISELGSKSYWNTFDDTPEFVIMFLPGEVFFSTALQEDPELIEFGMDKKVILASPLTLIALLRSVAYGWQQESIAENAQEIRNLGAELYERVSGLAGYFGKLGRSLEQSVGHFNSAIGSLESRTLVSARRFKEMGVPADKDIPQVNSIDTAVRNLQADEFKSLPQPEEEALSVEKSPAAPADQA